MTVLVTGATGNVGSHVVRELQRRGVAVRAMARDAGRAETVLGPDVEVAQGDFEDPRSVGRALSAVDRVFLSSADGPRKVDHERAVIDACSAADVRLIVKASTLSADASSPSPPFSWNGRSEDHLRRSGVPAVILRSSFYMSNLRASTQEGRLVVPAGSGRVAMIDPADVGAAAAVVLSTDGHAGRTYALTGPEAISFAEAAAALGLRYVDVPPAAAAEGLRAAGMPGWLIDHLDHAFSLIRAGAMEEVSETVRRLTGRVPRTVAQFAVDRTTPAGALR